MERDLVAGMLLAAALCVLGAVGVVALVAPGSDLLRVGLAAAIGGGWVGHCVVSRRDAPQLVLAPALSCALAGAATTALDDAHVVERVKAALLGLGIGAGAGYGAGFFRDR